MKRPTTAAELQAWLVLRGLYPHYVAADGTEPYDGYGLKGAGNSWVVFRCAPMTVAAEKRFNNELMAVDELIERMRFGGFAEQLNDFEPRRRILLVNYHADTNRVMGKLLQLTGFEAVCAATIAEARAAAAAGRFDVMISRVWMPDGDPKEFMRELAAAGTKGIAQGGWRQDGELEELQAAGFEDYLDMPIAYERLKSAITRAIGIAG